MAVWDRIFKQKGIKTKSDEQSGASLINDARTSTSLTVAIAAHNAVLGKGESYAPLQDMAMVQDLVNAGYAALGHELDAGFAPTPFGGSHPDLQRDGSDEADYSQYRKNPNLDNRTTLYADGVKELVLKANSNNAYMSRGRINGNVVDFLLDTGATQVSIPEQLGLAIGLEPSGRTTSVHTANGIVNVQKTLIEDLHIGDIHLRFVEALLNPGDRSNTILLGMSALGQLEFTHRNGQLILRQLSR